MYYIREFSIMKNLSNKKNRFLLSFNFLVILILVFPGLGKAATITWDGSSSTDWTTAANWSSNSVPTASDIVIIPSGVPNDPIITTSVTITSMAISQGAMLTIQPSGTLTVNGASSNGVNVYGQLTNNGKLYIDNTGLDGMRIISTNGSAKAYLYGDTYIGSSGNIGGDGIYVEDELVVDTDPVNQYDLTPTLTIDRTTGSGIACSGCTAHIRESGTGISTPTTTVKMGTTGSIGFNGIRSNGDFNFIAGSVTIEDSGANQDGVVNLSGGDFSMGNNAELKIGSVSAQITGNGIENQDQFSSAGSININNTVESGIENQSNGTFTNTGDIEIGTIANIDQGIANSGQFTSSGLIQVSNTTDIAIYIIAGSFSNTGTVDIGSLGTIGKIGLFLNGSGATGMNEGLIKIEDCTFDGIYIINNASFSNSSTGEIRIGQAAIGTTRAGMLMTDGGAFYNDGGVIKVDHSTVAGINAQSNGIFENNNQGLIHLGANSTLGVGSINVPGGVAGQITNGSCSVIIQYEGNKFNAANGMTNNGYIIDYSSLTNSLTTNNGIIQNLNGGGFIMVNNGVVTTEEGTLWTGCTNTDWHEASNWAGDIVPGSSDVALVLPATNNPIIQSGNTANIQSLTVSVNGKLRNNGTLSVMGSTADGISNEGELNNYGELRVDNTSGSGIENKNGATISNEGSGVMWLGNDSGNIGSYGVRNANLALFNNLAGTVYIDNTADHAFFNDNAYFAGSASSELNIGTQSGSIGGAGIFNTGASGFMINFASTVQIDKATSYGIVNETDFKNQMGGEVTLGVNAGVAGLLNSATGVWNNEGCSVASFFNSLSNAGLIDNDALFYLNTTATHTNTGTISNDGILSYTTDNTVPNVSNNGIVVEPIELECGYFASDALQIGSSNTFTVLDEWFNDTSLTNKAGDYDQADNTFTATNQLLANDTLYFTASSGSCIFDLSIATTVSASSSIFPSGQRTWTGSISTDWGEACNWLPSNVPTADDEVTIPNVTNAPVISSGDFFTIKSLTVLANGMLTNDGTLNVQGSEGHGITNKGVLLNNGELGVDGTTWNGINNDNGGTFTNSSTGTIWLGNDSGDIGINGIDNYNSDFNNLGGMIYLDNIDQHGIVNRNGATFVNSSSAELNIGTQSGAIGVTGITNNDVGNVSTFYNSGTILIAQASTIGIHNKNNFYNQGNGEVIIGSNTGTGAGINNTSGTWFNEDCSIVRLENGFINEGTVDNDALFYFNTTATHTNTGTFTNDGIVSYTSDNSVPNVSNNGIVIEPVALECGYVASNALQIGSTNSFTVLDEWFSDEALTEKVGDYDQAGNTFLAENPILATDTLYFTATNGTCTFDLTIKTTLNTPDTLAAGIRTWTGAINSNWNLACNWSPANVPTMEDDVIIPNVATGPVLFTSESAFCKELTIEDNATLTIEEGVDFSAEPKE